MNYGSIFLILLCAQCHSMEFIVPILAQNKEDYEATVRSYLKKSTCEITRRGTLSLLSMYRTSKAENNDLESIEQNVRSGCPPDIADTLFSTELDDKESNTQRVAHSLQECVSLTTTFYHDVHYILKQRLFSFFDYEQQIKKFSSYTNIDEDAFLLTHVHLFKKNCSIEIKNKGILQITHFDHIKKTYSSKKCDLPFAYKTWLARALVQHPTKPHIFYVSLVQPQENRAKVFKLKISKNLLWKDISLDQDLEANALYMIGLPLEETILLYTSEQYFSYLSAVDISLMSLQNFKPHNSSSSPLQNPLDKNLREWFNAQAAR